MFNPSISRSIQSPPNESCGRLRGDSSWREWISSSDAVVSIFSFWAKLSSTLCFIAWLWSEVVLLFSFGSITSIMINIRQLNNEKIIERYEKCYNIQCKKNWDINTCGAQLLSTSFENSFVWATTNVAWVEGGRNWFSRILTFELLKSKSIFS